MSQMNMNALALPAAVAAGAFGFAAMEAPDAEAASLNAFGPAYSHNLGTANQQLDERLRDEGPDGCAAQAIAKLAGITTAAGRAKYVTPDNVSFRREVTITNQQDPTNTGATASCAVVEIPNDHSSSLAATVDMKKAPASAIVKARKLADGSYELFDGHIRLDCGGNALLNNARPKSHKKINGKHIKTNVTFGVMSELQAVASSPANSTSSSHSTEVCADGTLVDATSGSQASAYATALAMFKAKGEKFFITGNNVSFSDYQKKFAKTVTGAEAEVTAYANSTATSNATSTITCGTTPNTPPPVCTGTPEQCSPKTDGPIGPGGGTPGNTGTGSTVGGTGAGGQPGNETSSVPCYDPNTASDGDMDPNTQGATMFTDSTSKVDIAGYCIGQAQAAVNG